MDRWYAQEKCNFEHSYSLKKNSLILIIVITSLVLLVGLQIVWLRSSYRNEVFSLRREANGIFRNTVFQLRELGMIEEIDSALNQVPPSAIQSVQILSAGVRKDTNLTDEGSQAMRVYFSTTSKNDSLEKIMTPFRQKIKGFKGIVNSNLSIRIYSDSIDLPTLQQKFDNNLSEIGIPLASVVKENSSLPWPPQNLLFPRIQRSESEEMDNHPLFSDTLTLESSRLSPARSLTASLTGVRVFILKKITPQILFSVFLTGMTVLAFTLIYRSMRHQQKLMALKNDFISNMTHELKTPVATVSVALEALRDFNGLSDPKRTEEYLSIAQSELNRLSLLTDKIMKSVIFESQEIVFHSGPVALDQVVNEVVASLRLVFEKQGAHVSFEKTGFDFTIMGSFEHLTSVVFNLLDNALKYSLKQPEITVRLLSESGTLTLEIKDKGIGIPPEFQNRIFEKFFRVPTGDVHTIKGYGLGLSYVHSVVKSHQGSIRVTSEPGIGTAFTLVFSKP
jgi:two-component system phosphate regulon sensor histidine kinase PhoR